MTLIVNDGTPEMRGLLEKGRKRLRTVGIVMLILGVLGLICLFGPITMTEIAMIPLFVFFFVRVVNTFPIWIHGFGQPSVLVSIALLANPTSLRYVADFRDYELFQSRKDLECMRYAIRVADEGMRQMREALVPGVTCARCHRKVAMTVQLMRNGDFM